MDREGDGEGLPVGVTDVDGDSDTVPLGDGDSEGDTEGEAVPDADTVPLPVMDPVTLGLLDALGDSVLDADTEGVRVREGEPLPLVLQLLVAVGVELADGVLLGEDEKEGVTLYVALEDGDTVPEAVQLAENEALGDADVDTDSDREPLGDSLILPVGLADVL